MNKVLSRVILKGSTVTYRSSFLKGRKKKKKIDEQLPNVSKKKKKKLPNNHKTANCCCTLEHDKAVYIFGV